MTTWFPLSISDHPDARMATLTSTATPPIEDLRDDLIHLRRRNDTRLWFRKSDSTALVELHQQAEVLLPSAKSTENPGTDKLVGEMVRVVQAGPETPVASPSASRDVVAPSETITWRAVQAGAPVLLLSAGPVLESSRPGPILGPGMRYRITGMTGSMVAMEVMHSNGDTRSGYANAVDLRCLEPKLHTGEFRMEKGLTGRLRLTKLATTTFGLFGG